MRALYPGSFDPLTNGHMDLIERASALFGEVIVAVLSNPSKKPLFTVEERIAQIRVSTAHLERIEVISFDGLTVNCAVTHHADLILRGLRAMSDFEYELQIAHTNRSLTEDLETVFLDYRIRIRFFLLGGRSQVSLDSRIRIRFFLEGRFRVNSNRIRANSAGI